MSRRKQNAEEWKDLAAERGEEDGTDAQEFHAKPWNAPKKATRKGLQLCGQVKDALTVALPACADVGVQGLVVLAVEPAPHTGRLLVLVGASPDDNRGTVLQALTRASGFLRSNVAAVISRRHAPELIFEVVGG